MKTEIEFRNQSRGSSELVSIPLAIVLLWTLSILRAYAMAGDVDLTFDPGSSMNGSMRAIAIQNDGKVMIGGTFSTVHGAMCSGLARLEGDGSVDDSFHATL